MWTFFGSKATSIPRIQGDPGVRLACRDPQGQPLTAQGICQGEPLRGHRGVEQSEGASIGTGVIMTSDGYIITNAHVISGGKSCWVALDTGVTYEVNLVGFDEEEDLAVLKADPQNPLPAAEFGNSDLVQVGDTAYAIGNPWGWSCGHHDQRHHLRRQPRRGGGRQDRDPAADQRRPEQRQLRRSPDQ
ncbi:MAG: S1C family serine protease [Oscillospiraceae bacterium]